MKQHAGKAGEGKDFQTLLKTQWKLPAADKRRVHLYGHCTLTQVYTLRNVHDGVKKDVTLLFSPPLPPPLSSFPLLDFNEITIPETDHSPTMERFWIFTWCEMIEVLERKKTIESIYMKRGFIRLVYTILSQVVQQ